MKFSQWQVTNLFEHLFRIEAYYAKRYKVDISQVAILFKGEGLHILIDGELKEGLKIASLGYIKEKIPEDIGTTLVELDRLTAYRNSKYKPLEENGKYKRQR